MLEALSRDYKSGNCFKKSSFSDKSHHCSDLSEAVFAFKNNGLEVNEGRLKVAI